MGHTRWATQGSITDKNAHPFIHKHIMLAHNGGIWNKEELVNGGQFDVDSEAICHSIASIGALETLKTLKGNFALTYYDFDTKTFNIVRNGGRPLALAKHKNRNTFYYASEGKMLAWIAERNKIDLDKIIEISEAKLVSFNVTNGDFNDKTVGFHTPQYTEHRAYGGHGGGFWRDTHDKRGRESSEPPFTGGGRENTGGTREVGSDDTIPCPPVNLHSGGTAANSSSREIVSIFPNSRGPLGSGVLYLRQWGLALHDVVEVFLFSPELVSPKSHHMRAEACMTGETQPNCEIIIRGFTETEYNKIKNTEDKYYTRIAQCWWNEQKGQYSIGCHDIFTEPPGKVIAAFDSRKVEVKKEKDTEGLDRGYLPAKANPKDDSKESSNKADEKILSVDDLSEDEITLLATKMSGSISFQDLDSFEPKEYDLVKGPGSNRVRFDVWERLTKHGCSNCSCQLRNPDKTYWWNAPGTDFPFCEDCKTEGKVDEAKGAY